MTLRRGQVRWFRFEHPDKRRPVLVVGLSTLPPDRWPEVREATLRVLGFDGISDRS